MRSVKTHKPTKYRNTEQYTNSILVSLTNSELCEEKKKAKEKSMYNSTKKSKILNENLEKITIICEHVCVQV